MRDFIIEREGGRGISCRLLFCRFDNTIISILFDGNFSMDVESILGTSVSNEEKFLSTK